MCFAKIRDNILRLVARHGEGVKMGALLCHGPKFVKEKLAHHKTGGHWDIGWCRSGININQCSNGRHSTNVFCVRSINTSHRIMP